MYNNAHRFSIEWSRIEPEEGKFNQGEIEHYRKVLQALRARGLEPLVTLHHFTNPIWFAKKGGWANKRAPEYFERYVEYVARHLGGEAKYWMTINEPLIVNSLGYLSGRWPPFKKRDFLGYFRAISNMAEAHRRAYGVLHKYNVDAKVGAAKNNNYFESVKDIFWPLNFLIVYISKYFKNERFLNKIKNHQDFIGLNYYNHYKFSLFKGFYQDGKERSDFGWEIYPEGIYHVAKEIYKKYKKPIYITENGISDADDSKRPKFIKEHLQWLHKAIQEGADVRGYFYWSLLDNFEWTEGFTQKFGLVEVNFETFERKMRPSGELYGEICKNNALKLD